MHTPIPSLQNYEIGWKDEIGWGDKLYIFLGGGADPASPLCPPLA